MKMKIFFLLFSSIASKSHSIPSSSAWKEILEAYDTVLEKVSQTENDCLAVTPKKIRHFFERVENFAARVKDDCSEFAGSGNKNDFIRPSVDNPNRIEMMHNFYDSVKSFQNAFVCMDGNTNKKWRSKIMVRYINRQIRWTEKRGCGENEKTPEEQLKLLLESIDWKPFCFTGEAIETFCNPERIEKLALPHKMKCPVFSQCIEPTTSPSILLGK